MELGEKKKILGNVGHQERGTSSTFVESLKRNKMKRASSFCRHVPRASSAELWPHLLPTKEKEENAVVKKKLIFDYN